VVILASPTEKSDAQPSPNGGGGSYDKKGQTEQARKNYIIRRFISYYPVNRASY